MEVVFVVEVVVRLRFLPPSFCEALRMGSVGPSLDSGAVVGAEVCAAVDVEEEGEGRMSLMRVGLGLAGIAGGRAWFRGEGWRGRTGSLGLYAVVRWYLRARCFLWEGFLLEAGKFRIVVYFGWVA